MIRRIQRFMSSESEASLLERLRSGRHFAFLAARHPLDRLLSAYRDRIMDGRSGQAMKHVPKMLGVKKYC